MKPWLVRSPNSPRVRRCASGAQHGSKPPTGAHPRLLPEERARPTRSDILGGVSGRGGRCSRGGCASRSGGTARPRPHAPRGRLRSSASIASGLRRIDWSGSRRSAPRGGAPSRGRRRGRSRAAPCRPARHVGLQKGELERHAAAVASGSGVGVIRTAMNSRTLSTMVSHRLPSMMASWVALVAPFHEIFTSDVMGTMSLAHAFGAEAREGAVRREVQLHDRSGGRVR
jgi:hypothetical protein